MLQGFAKVRGLKRWILVVPVMTPKLSSYWLYFITATSYKLAAALVSSMRVEVVCRNTEINDILSITPMGYTEALERTFAAIETHEIVSSWKDSLISGRLDQNLSAIMQVPEYGCFTDERSKPVPDRERCLDRIWNLGGERGWYYGNWLWKVRGFIDKLFGGVGLRRGRTNPARITPGDAVDFWRVVFASREAGRLLLFAEMKLPGEAWLEFKLDGDKLYQKATFRPKGVWGRMYWYSVLPFHGFIFKGMIESLVK